MPPGPKRLLTILPSLVGPPVLTGALLVFLKNHNYLHQLSLWAIPAICLAVHPVLFYVNCYARRFFDWRAASRLGAVLPPLVTDTGMTVISRAKASFINGYPGTFSKCESKNRPVLTLSLQRGGFVQLHERLRAKLCRISFLWK